MEVVLVRVYLMLNLCLANMEAPVIVLNGRTFRWIGGCAYRDGEWVLKLPAMYPFSEYRLLQLFHELAPQYSPGPVSAVTVNGRNGVLMRFAGGVLGGDDRLERVMGFLQSIHCLLLVSSHMAMRGLRARHLRRRGGGVDVQFRLVHVGAWVKSGESWQNNCTEIERLWKDVGWANVQHADRTDPEIVREMVARAGAAVGRYASEFSSVPPAMGELRSAIEETAGKVCVFGLFSVSCVRVTHPTEIARRGLARLVALAEVRGPQAGAREREGAVRGVERPALRQRAQAQPRQRDMSGAGARGR